MQQEEGFHCQSMFHTSGPSWQCIKSFWKVPRRGSNIKSELRAHICREHSNLIGRKCVIAKHIRLSGQLPNTRESMLSPSVLTDSAHPLNAATGASQGTIWVNPVSVAAVAPGQWRDFLGVVFGARPQCMVGVPVSHDCVDAAIETVNSFLNVSHNTQADTQALIECGTSQSTRRKGDYQLICSSLHISSLALPTTRINSLQPLFFLSLFYCLTVISCLMHFFF